MLPRASGLLADGGGGAHTVSRHPGALEDCPPRRKGVLDRGLSAVVTRTPTCAPWPGWSYRKFYKGLSIRVVPYYDGTNDISNYRLHCLFGVKTLDGRLATRVSGT
jgi:hypothetical protein